MNPDRATGSGTGSRRVLAAIFAFSGATSLIFETVWARQLELVFGTSQLAVSTVLAAFMTGLALGGFAAARWGMRSGRPLIAYAIIEACVGAYALLLPWLLGAIVPLYLAFARAVDPGPLGLGIFQFILVGGLLLPPAAGMGATLPLLVRFATAGTGDTGWQVGRLYGANTLGAVLGAALAGFVLLPRTGVTATTWTAACANGVIALAALALASGRITRSRPPAAAPGVDPALPTLLLLAALTGFSGLLYEVAWFRLMVLILGGSAYAFTIMLLAFLLGIGFGGGPGGWSADRTFRRGGAGRVLRRVAWLQIGVAALAWAAMAAYGQLPFAFVWLFDHAGSGPVPLLAAELLLALAVMLLPAILMGATFPHLVRAAAAPGGGAGRVTGRLYGANTLGAAAGAFTGGFFLLPALHIQGTVLAAASLNVVAAVVVVSGTIPVGRPRRGVRLSACVAAGAVAVLVMAVLAPAWDPMLMTSGMYRYVTGLDHRTRQGVRTMVKQRAELVFYDEGLTSVVTVGRDPRTGNIWLANNGKVDASTLGDVATQSLLAHLPLLFRPEARRVLVIGLASGITAGSVTLHAAPARIDVAEIEPSVVEASRAFDEHNHRPLDDPRVHVVVNDARNTLLRVPDGTYDLVTAEPSNPWLSGVSSLFTREFFATGRRKMAPDGIWAQWLQCYGMSPDDLRSLMGTFADVFPHVRVFRVSQADLVLLGSGAPLPMTAEAFAAPFRSRAVARDLAVGGITTPEALLARYYFARPAVLVLARGVQRNTDDNMRIEYSAPLHLYEITSIRNTVLLRSATEVPFPALGPTGDRLLLADAYLEDGDLGRAAIVGHAVAETSPDDPRLAALLETIHRMKPGAIRVAEVTDRPDRRPRRSR